MRRLSQILTCFLLSLYCAAGPLASATPRAGLSSDQLLHKNTLDAPLPMAEFMMPDGAPPPVNHFAGTLVSHLQPGNHRILRDEFDLHSNGSSNRESLPAFKFDLVQDGDYLIPVNRGPQGVHPDWQLIVLPGRVWQEPGDRDYSRASLPFSLQERGQNCTHNGVMSFLFKSDGAVSRLAYQVSSETCHYYQADMWGLLDISYLPGNTGESGTVARQFRQELASRIPTRPLDQLAVDYPGSDPSRFANTAIMTPQEVSLYGFVIDGVNYLGECPTRHGPYPFCDMLVLPSYSLAKSLYVGLGLMYLEQRWPGSKETRVADLVPDCDHNGNWDQVTLEHLADMTTGNYDSPEYDADETSIHSRRFLAARMHAEKIALACNHFPQRAKPGARWVYHSSDSYIASTAFNNYLSRKTGRPSDFFEHALLEAVWRPLKLSPTSEFPLRTEDESATPFGYNGFSFLADDVAKLIEYLNAAPGTGSEKSALDGALFAAATQRNEKDRGIPTSLPTYHYRAGFWGVRTGLCAEDIHYPFMSGYGGITVALFPNDSAYYMFSDGKTFDWREPAAASHAIRGFCKPRAERLRTNH